MNTSRGIRLSLLASRGLLDNHIPPELTSFLTMIKSIGLDIEISADLYKTMINISLAQGNEKKLIDLEKEYVRLYYPAMKDEFDTLKEKVTQQIVQGGDIMTIRTATNKTINPNAIRIKNA